MLVLLAVTFGEGGSASNGEPRRKGTINHYFVSLCVFIPYRQNLAYAPFCHSQPLLSLCDISSASTEEFTPEGGSRRTIYNLPTGKYNFATQNLTAVGNIAPVLRDAVGVVPYGFTHKTSRRQYHFATQNLTAVRQYHFAKQNIRQALPLFTERACPLRLQV